MAFTTQDENRLNELLKKRRKAQREAREELKKLNNACQREFGMTFEEVRQFLESHGHVFVSKDEPKIEPKAEPKTDDFGFDFETSSSSFGV